MKLPAVHAAADLRSRPDELPMYTTDEIPGQRIVAVKGLVRGNTIRARHLGNDIIALFKSVVGGEITEYTKMMGESREQALDRMRAEALMRGANAVVGVRFTTAMIMQGTAEILAYGTAVVATKMEP